MNKIIENQVYLKSIETQKTKLAAEIREDERNLERLRGEAKALATQVSIKQHRIRNLNQDIENLKRIDKVVVTEHAILRYLERVKGVDIEAIKKEILTDQLIKQVMTLSSGIFPIPGTDFKLKVRKGSVLTVIEK